MNVRKLTCLSIVACVFFIQTIIHLPIPFLTIALLGFLFPLFKLRGIAILIASFMSFATLISPYNVSLLCVIAAELNTLTSITTHFDGELLFHLVKLGQPTPTTFAASFFILYVTQLLATWGFYHVFFKTWSFMLGEKL